MIDHCPYLQVAPMRNFSISTTSRQGIGQVIARLEAIGKVASQLSVVERCRSTDGKLDLFQMRASLLASASALHEGVKTRKAESCSDALTGTDALPCVANGVTGLCQGPFNPEMPSVPDDSLTWPYCQESRDNQPQPHRQPVRFANGVLPLNLMSRLCPNADNRAVTRRLCPKFTG